MIVLIVIAILTLCLLNHLAIQSLRLALLQCFAATGILGLTHRMDLIIIIANLILLIVLNGVRTICGTISLPRTLGDTKHLLVALAKR